MSKIAEYANWDAVAIGEMVRKGEVSPSELLEEAIARTEKVNPKLNAVVLKHYDEARASLNSLPENAPLKGVPFLLKDLYALLKGTITSNGARLTRNARADHDSVLTERFRQAGLVIFGKTNSPEFGLTGTTEPVLYGPTKNPWDETRSSGGSSGGAAAAVAAGVLPAAHASDGGGSIRIPASACGLFGLKPSRGRVPMGPDVGEGWAGMSISHVVSRSVRDSAAILDAICGMAAGSPYDAPPRQNPYLGEVAHPVETLRIGFNALRPNGSKPDADIVAGLEDAAALCASLGHRVEEARPDLDVMAMLRCQTAIIGANVAQLLGAMGEARGRPIQEEEVEPATWRLVESGRALKASDYVAAVHFIHGLGRTMAAFHESYDLYLTPTLGAPPPLLGELAMTREAREFAEALQRVIPYTPIANMTGEPSMSVPLFWNEAGLPIGVMFTAAYGREDLLFRLAGQLEEARSWKGRRPPIHS